MSDTRLTSAPRARRSHPARTPGAAAALGAAGALLLAASFVLGAYLRVHGGPTRFDSWALTRIGPHYHSVDLRALAELGGAASVGVVLVLALALAWKERRRAAVAAVAGPAVAFVLAEIVLKHWVGRHIGSGLSYPSGHVTAISSLAADVSLVMGKRGTRFAAIFVGVLATAAVAIAVVALGWHFPTDAIGGALVGSGSVLVVFALVSARRRRS